MWVSSVFYELCRRRDEIEETYWVGVKALWCHLARIIGPIICVLEPPNTDSSGWNPWSQTMVRQMVKLKREDSAYPVSQARQSGDMLLYYCRTQQWPIPRSLNVTEPYCWSMSLQHSEAFTNCLERWIEHTHIICCTGWESHPRHTMIYRPCRLQCCLSASHWTISISA